MLPTEDLFVYVYVLIDDAIASRGHRGPGPAGPAPACSDAELLAIALVRHLLGRRSEAGFLAEVGPGLGAPVPAAAAPKRGEPADPLAAGRVRAVRGRPGSPAPEDDCQQVDTCALPVKHASRVRGPDRLDRPG